MGQDEILEELKNRDMCRKDIKIFLDTSDRNAAQIARKLKKWYPHLLEVYIKRERIGISLFMVEYLKLRH